MINQNSNQPVWEKYFNIIPSPIIVFKLDLSYLYSNQAAEKLWALVSYNSNKVDNEIIDILMHIGNNYDSNKDFHIFDFKYNQGTFKVKAYIEFDLFFLVFESYNSENKELSIIKDFLHDFNNPIFIASGKLSQIKNRIERNELSKIDLKREIEICLKSIGRANDSVNILKSNL